MKNPVHAQTPGQVAAQPEGQAAESGAPARGWAPRGRQQWADRIADELAEPPGFSRAAWLQMTYGDLDPEPDPLRLVDLCRVETDLSQPPVQRAIQAAWQLAAARHRPPGAVRAVKGMTTTRMVRATGEGWSLLARPGVGPAVLLLDQAPGQVIDLTGTERLPELIDALTTAAHRH